MIARPLSLTQEQSTWPTANPGAGCAISAHPHVGMPPANLSSSLATAVSECYMGQKRDLEKVKNQLTSMKDEKVVRALVNPWVLGLFSINLEPPLSPIWMHNHPT
jgi:hypothetical protein